jgi:RHS repeat-associated protein
MSDLHGDLITTFTTTLTTSTAYDPFGKVTAQTGTATTLGYQGEYTDPDTGKVNMHARWYQPSTGTFTSRDTMTLNPNPSVQANRYTYANAGPLSHIDFTGHAAVDCNTPYWCFLDGKNKEALSCVQTFHTVMCASGESISRKVGGYVQKMEGNTETKRRSAIRHFMWQMFTAVLINEGFAKVIGDRHEEYSANNPVESAEDQKVNAYARAYARKYKDKIVKMVSEQGFDYAKAYYYRIAEYEGCKNKFFVVGCRTYTATVGHPHRASASGSGGGYSYGNHASAAGRAERQAEIDAACTYGSCTGSYSGHSNTIGSLPDPNADWWDSVMDREPSYEGYSWVSLEKVERQAEIDAACTYGSCTGSYSGHSNTIGSLPDPNADWWDSVLG